MIEKDNVDSDNWEEGDETQKFSDLLVQSFLRLLQTI